MALKRIEEIGITISAWRIWRARAIDLKVLSTLIIRPAAEGQIMDQLLLSAAHE